jgi:hypothetical protein
MAFIFASLLELAVIGHLVKDEGIKKKPPVICKARVRTMLFDTSFIYNLAITGFSIGRLTANFSKRHLQLRKKSLFESLNEFYIWNV